MRSLLERCLGEKDYSLVNTLERALDGEVVLELDGHLLPCEGLERREDELEGSRFGGEQSIAGCQLLAVGACVFCQSASLKLVHTILLDPNRRI